MQAVVWVAAAMSAAAAAGGCAVLREAPAAQRADAAVGTYWCPMHPDVRGSRGDVCHICRMEMVPAGVADYQPYLLELDLVPRALHAGQRGRLVFRVVDPRTRRTVTDFEQLHERVFHLFVVGHDLEYFAHVHPELREGGALEMEIELPRPGAYRLIADFLPIGGAPQLIEKSIVTAGYAGPVGPVAALKPDVARKAADATDVELILPPAVAGREQLVTFALADRATGRPVTNLEPYLGATGHLLVMSGDLAVSFHSHPVAAVTSAFGPEIVFQMVFPRPGMYRLWLQFQRQGEVGTVSFTIPVSEREVS